MTVFLFPGLFSNFIAGYLGSHQLYLAASSFLTLSVICCRVVLETSPCSLARIEGELVLRTRKRFSASGLPLQRPSLMLNSFLVKTGRLPPSFSLVSMGSQCRHQLLPPMQKRPGLLPCFSGRSMGRSLLSEVPQLSRPPPR